MNIQRWLRNALHNRVAQQKLTQLPEGSLYARTYAEFYRASMRQGVGLQQAGMALERRIDELIRNRQHHYDMVVLHKDQQRVTVRDRRGKEHNLLDIVTNSYNDLEWVDENREALVQFVHDAPLSSCISRKIAGLHDVHDKLARELADFMGYESCVLGTCGYVSQLSTIFALFHDGDVIFSDEYNHSSLVDGCRLSHARVITYRHRDYEHLEELVRKHRGEFNGAGILSDGVFSTRGSVADVNRMVELARRYNCISVVDDTHGVLVCGRQGRGVVDLFDVKPDVITGGFGKAFGSFGGFALSSRSLGTAIDVLGRQNVNTSFLSPIVAAQALINFRYYREHREEVQGDLMRLVRRFNDELGRAGIACYPEPNEHIHPIFCLHKEHERETLECHNTLIDKGYFCSFFPPPVAPFPSLRFSLHRFLPESELVEVARLLSTMGLFVDSGGRLKEKVAHHYAPPPREPLLTSLQSQTKVVLDELRRFILV